MYRPQSRHTRVLRIRKTPDNNQLCAVVSLQIIFLKFPRKSTGNVQETRNFLWSFPNPVTSAFSTHQKISQETSCFLVPKTPQETSRFLLADNSTGNIAFPVDIQVQYTSKWDRSFVHFFVLFLAIGSFFLRFSLLLAYLIWVILHLIHDLLKKTWFMVYNFLYWV